MPDDIVGSEGRAQDPPSPANGPRVEEAIESLRGEMESLGAMLAALAGAGERVISLEEGTDEPARRSIESVRLAVAEQRETFDRRLELLGRQIGAQLGRVRAQLEQMAPAERPEGDLARAAEAVSEPLAVLKDHLVAIVDLLRSVGERLAALELASNAVGRSVAMRAEAISGTVAESLGASLQRIERRIAEIERRVTGIDRRAVDVEGRVAGLASEERIGQQQGHLQDLSGSVGAVYLRLRSLEEGLAEVRADARSGTSGIAEILIALKDLGTLEQRLAVRLAAMENRLADVEGHREIASLLSELADDAADRERRADRRFGRQRRSGAERDPRST